MLDHLGALAREMAAFESAARRGPLAAHVDACPEWTAGDLVAHLGEVHRWAAHHVRDRPDRMEWGWADPWEGPAHDPGIADWYREGADVLLATLRDADPAATVPTFLGPGTAAFWARRQAQETLVHRWDIETACGGAPAPLDGELAADGVDEFLTVFAPRRRRQSERAGGGESVHVHRTDGDGEWIVRFAAGSTDAAGVVVERTHAKGDVAVRGDAEDLLLWLWMRRDTSPLDIVGDPSVLDVFRELVPPT